MQYNVAVILVIAALALVVVTTSSSSSSDEEKAPRVKVLESAMAKETELKKLMAEPGEEWDKHSALTKNMYVWKYLGVSGTVVHADIETLTLKGLRALYLNRWVIKPTDRSDYLATLLLRGKLMCKHCIRVNSQGSFTAKSANVEQHGRGGKHVKRLEDAKKTKVKKTLKSAVSSSAAAPAAATSASDPAEREEVVSYQPGLEVFYGRRGKAPGFLDDSERAKDESEEEEGKEDDDDDEEEEEEEEFDPKKAGKIAPLVLDSEEEAAIEAERAAGRRAREALLRKP